ncbi:hypothetical protein HYPSUDRAFT_438549 [Hypholoma sublateritium FD-334 SS-4]|uniref:Transmembrane protein n=1 Tax=Hypholoma sublateritium (strain FD-334 SS-4) TaxID=945553 RepID=A0A0D2P2D8_HYPSF|nr:hypothetical protein HYPSUDRAFT_438549 [Hypholoma sublateritium FD-334 SS-4]
MSWHNLTIGNDILTAIVYDPPLCNGTGWVVNPQLSGSPRSCTTSNEIIPTANLTFTGVAVYYTSPTFNGESVGFILDGASSVDISLSEAHSQASNKTAMRVVWNATALENKQHILQLRPANGSKTLNVNAFIVTQLDSNATSIVPATQASTSISSSIMGLPTQSSNTTRVTIVLGTTFGALSFIIFLGIAFFLRSRSRSLKKRYSWSKYIPPLREATDLHTRTRTVNSVNRSTVDDRNAGDSVLPMRPIHSSVVPDTSIHGHYLDDHRQSDGARGWVSPVPSNLHLLNDQSPLSSPPGHDEPTGSPTYKFGSVRSPGPLAGPRPCSDSGSAHGHRNSSTFVSRDAPISSKLEATILATTSGDSVNGLSVSRSTTLNSTRLQPVRKASTGPRV